MVCIATTSCCICLKQPTLARCKARGCCARLQGAGDGWHTGARPTFINAVKAVEELEVVLDLSLQRNLAGRVSHGGISPSFQRTCHHKRAVLRGGQGIQVCRINLAEVMYDDLLVRTAPFQPFAPWLEPLLHKAFQEKKKGNKI